MNKKQKMISLVVIGVIVVMFLFPPILCRGSNYGHYRFIFNTGCPVNATLLLTQWVGVLIVGAIAYFMAKGTKTILQPQGPIKENVLQEPFSEELKAADNHTEEVTEKQLNRFKTEVGEKQFKRFKIATVLAYLVFFSVYSLAFLEKGDLNNILTMIWAVCLLLTSCVFWVYLWKCAKIVHKRPLHYVALTILIPFVGAGWAYTRLRSKYDNPFLKTW